MKSLILGTVLGLLFSSSIFASESECEGPTGPVRVTVEQIAQTPPVYHYVIANSYKSQIRNFTLGIGGQREQREMEVIPDNIPVSIGSPQGWEGQYIFPEETGHMHIFWLAKHDLYAIAPNASLGGFALVMPKPMERKVPLYGPDGKLSVPTDMKKVSFRVRFNDGKCAWGRVVPVGIEDALSSSYGSSGTEKRTYLIEDENTPEVSVLGVRRMDGLLQIRDKLKDKFAFEERTALAEGEEIVITVVKDSEPLLSITTMGDGNRIWGMWVESPRISTAKGIHIGSRLSDVVASYGEPKEVSWGEGSTVAIYKGLQISFALEYAGPKLSPDEALWWKNTAKHMNDIVVKSIGIRGSH